ncbi:hypothetical protein C9374_010472 [Naegleria lovaniensis]|uniref:Protein kinase domain-containing protein n=1 Tax=Naegleria lovaniensis TaxID=51637 RepID=A0AA88GH13_NAELO|nr:uncharacterized protein C9374_010472 [Naegleria lovaniensis]KAG2374728.1 hypothetical protein C9374_010472 [Naegleria lovaniensis]
MIRDGNFVLQQVKHDGFALEYASQELRNDREIVLEAVKQNGFALEYASQELRNDREIVLEAVKQNGFALEYASQELRNDRGFVLEAVKQNGFAFRYASQELINDRGFVLEVVTIEKSKEGISSNIKTCLLFHPSLQKHPEIITYIIQEGPKSFSFTSTIDEMIEHYSNNYISEQNAFEFYLYLDIKPSSTFFTLSSNYPKETVIEFALMKLFHKFIDTHQIDLNAFVHHGTSFNSIDYYLLSDSIQLFVNHWFQILKSTHYKQLKTIVNNIVQQFPIEILPKSCINVIVKFLNDWKKVKGFPRLTSIQELTSQNLSIVGTGADLDKIRKCCQIAKSQTQFKTIHFISLLGMGAQGVVLRCLNTSHGMVACKFSFEPTLDRQRAEEQFKVLKDPRVKGHVIDCIECGTIEWNGLHYPYIIMEMGKGTLEERIQSIHAKKMLNYNRETHCAFLQKQDLIWIVKCFIDILEAVNVLHGMNISHRDLKTGNIVLIQDAQNVQDGKAKLIDLDNSRNIQYRDSVTINVGTLQYMAPEIHSTNNIDRISDNWTISKYCDVFSLGCVLLRMLTNCSLQLDPGYLKATEEDLLGNKNPDHVTFFSDYGTYFHAAIATPYGESKLHHALYKELNRHIDPSWNVNDILGRCLMTMIQKDIETRRDCVKYIPILQAVKQSLEKEGENNPPDFSSFDLSILKEYQPSIIERLMRENRILKDLLKRNNINFEQEINPKQIFQFNNNSK